MSDWPEELDALTAAPKHHRVLLENDIVRVIETLVPPGETVPVHTHRWPGVSHLQTWSDFVRRDEKGEILLDTRTQVITRVEGGASWQNPLGPHSLENVGGQTLKVLTVELKNLP